MIRLMPNPKLIEVISDGNEGNYVYIYNPNVEEKKDPVIMAWNVSQLENIKIPVNWKNISIIDMLGNVEKVAAKNGKVTVPVGPFPVYLKNALK